MEKIIYTLYKNKIYADTNSRVPIKKNRAWIAKTKGARELTKKEYSNLKINEIVFNDFKTNQYILKAIDNAEVEFKLLQRVFNGLDKYNDLVEKQFRIFNIIKKGLLSYDLTQDGRLKKDEIDNPIIFNIGQVGDAIEFDIDNMMIKYSLDGKTKHDWPLQDMSKDNWYILNEVVSQLAKLINVIFKQLLEPINVLTDVKQDKFTQTLRDVFEHKRELY